MSWCNAFTSCFKRESVDVFDILNVEDPQRRINMWKRVDWKRKSMDEMERVLAAVLDRDLWHVLGDVAFAHMIRQARIRIHWSLEYMFGFLAVIMFMSNELTLCLLKTLDINMDVWKIDCLFRYTPPHRMHHVQPVLCHLMNRVMLRTPEDEWYMLAIRHVPLSKVVAWPIAVVRVWFAAYPNPQITLEIVQMQDTLSARWIVDQYFTSRAPVIDQLSAFLSHTKQTSTCHRRIPAAWMFRQIIGYIPDSMLRYPGELWPWPCCTKHHHACFFALIERERRIVTMLKRGRLNPREQYIHRILATKVKSRDIVAHIMRFVFTAQSDARDRAFTQLCMAHRSASIQ